MKSHSANLPLQHIQLIYHCKTKVTVSFLRKAKLIAVSLEVAWSLDLG